VLAIEDNASNNSLIEAIMDKRGGIKLLVAVQGAVGLEMAREHRPELILLDLHLPDMTGLEVLQQLRESPETRDIPVMVLSADATKVQIERLLAAGATEYLTKPLNVKEVLKSLDRGLDKAPGHKA
jgi:CheY-like chemotaxis protein